MAIKRLFFSPQGKIDRSELLIGVCALVGAGLVVQQLFLTALASMAGLFTIGHGNVGLQVFGSIMFGLTALIQLYGPPVYFLLCIIPLYCLVAKRCHDRARGTFFAVLFTTALLLPTALQMLKLASRITGSEIYPHDVLSHEFVQITIAALSIWAVIEPGFLRGRDNSPETA